MASTIITKNKNTGAPSTLAAGELAINTEIGSLYYGSTGGTAVSSSFTFSNITSSGTISASGMIQTAGAISSSTGITASDAFFSGHITASNLSLAGNIHHTGDTNTKISFGADRLIAIAGGTTGIEMGSLGITTLTAGNALNIGAHTFTAKQLVANVTTGTAPMQITSTTLVSNLNADKLDGADLIDEDDMSSDSATAVPTQQSVKAYVDTNAGFSGNKFATDLKVGRDADNLIDFTTDNQVTFRVSAGDGIIMKASGEIEATKFDGDLEGNADTATALATGRTINGTSFDGTGNITLGNDSVTEAMMADNSIDSGAYVDASIDTAHIADAQVTTAKIADDAVTFAKAQGVTPNVFDNKIKLLPSDFVANDDGGNQKFGIGYVDDAGATTYGMRAANSLTELYAFVSIPQDMSATHVNIFGRTNIAVVVYEAQVNATSMTSKGTGNCNTAIDMSGAPVASTEHNFLAIKVTIATFSGGSADRIYGGHVTIAAS